VLTCEAVIFDLDNTLAESAWLWRESIAECARVHGAEITGTELREWICPAEDAPAVGARLGVTADYVRRWCTAYAAERADLVNLLPGADAMVSECADLVPVALCTSSSLPFVDGFSSRYPALTARFSVIVTGDDVTRRKPDPAAYLLAASRLGVCPENAIAVEDSTAGITAAAAAGLTVVAIPAMAKPAAPNALAAAHYVCADARDATCVIRGLIGHSLIENRVPQARPAITTLVVRPADATLAVRAANATLN
jgi:beta-phosphoglucomutase-like phosphatase (HAD superfamily)